MRIRVFNGMNRQDIKLPIKDAELNFMMKRIGVDQVTPVCKLVSAMDTEGLLDWAEGQMVNMDEINYLAKRMESLTNYEKDVIIALANDKGAGSVKDLINLTFSLKGISLITDFSDATQVGKRLYLDEFLGMTKSDEQEINFVKFAEKTFYEGRVQVLPHGVFVEHGFVLQEAYNGKTFPEYIYDSNDTIVSVEVQNKLGDKEYLYLPTNICEMNKVKARLQVQDFWECKVTDVNNMRLHETLLPSPEKINRIEDLTYFNELCQVVHRFDEARMTQLSMAVEFIGATDFKDITYIAKNLNAFEINPFVHSDEEYGRFLVTESGLFEVNELLLPYIDYEGFAKSKREGTLVESGYVANGFVGVDRKVQEYLQYGGEFADPLELDEDCFESFYLYSPLTANLVINGEDAGNLYRSDLISYEESIAEAIAQEECAGEEARGLMHYFSKDRGVASKVMAAYPKVKEVEGELYGVLECKISEPLTKEDIHILKDYWTGQMSDGWGEGFEQHPIEVEDGEIYVSFWNSEDFWSVMTEEELAEQQVQSMEMFY